MSQEALLQLAGIFFIGILAQWAAWRLKIPSIILLLAVGVVCGPVLGLLNPEQLMGDMLLPMVSLSVAVILYEGGLNLRFRELGRLKIRNVLLRIVTISVLISWAAGAAATHYIVGFPWPVAAMMGAVLVVTGPTVIGPMLRHLRLRGKVGSLLKWEGIVVDPLGAILAVLVFTFLRTEELREGLLNTLLDFGLTLAAGTALGGAAAALLVVAFRRYWLPDFLHNAVSLMLLFGAFTASNALCEESGLLAATVMGMVLANQRVVSIRHVVEFKETLTIILISFLFVTLAANLKLDDLTGLGWESVLFVVVMMLVVRPASILAATIGTSLSLGERLFMAWMAPRGIVAAAVVSVLSLEMVHYGFPQAIELVPITFLVVFATVLVYGLSAGPLARRFGLIQENPQGVLFVGAHAWAKKLAASLAEEKIPVQLIDADRQKVHACRMAGLACIYGNALSESTREEIDFSGLGRLFAVTPNNEVNTLVCLRYQEDFGRQEIYRLSFTEKLQGNQEAAHVEAHGRRLFGGEMNGDRMDDLLGGHATITKTKLTKEYDYAAYRKERGDGVVLLFVIKPGGLLLVSTAEGTLDPQPGDTILSVVPETA